MRIQFADQKPYYPGSFWLVDGIRYRIDQAGRARRCDTDEPVEVAWWTDGGVHEVRRLHLVLA